MKKSFYLLALCAMWAFALQTHAANVTPLPGVYYRIIQIPSNMVIGTTGTQPVVQTSSSISDQYFEFIPISGLTDTYYIKNYSGMYLNKTADNDWMTIYLSTQDPTNDMNAQFVITDDASSTTAFRLMLTVNNKYLATDQTNTNSFLYCDKQEDNVNGLFTLSEIPISPELNAAYEGLSLGDISSVKTNLTLPTTIGDKGVTVRWTSSNNAVIDTFGVVTVPPKFDVIVYLTATLSQTYNGKILTLTKYFTVKVTTDNSLPDEIAKWNFIPENITIENGVTTVKDEFSSGFVGTLKNDAKIRTIGSKNNTQFNVLDLGNNTGYFDMGATIGEDIYSLKDYTMSAYFRVDASYSEVGNSGNFLWTFSNTDNVNTAQNGYIILTMNELGANITPTDYHGETGNQKVAVGHPAPLASPNAAALDGWHHIAYVQNGITGTVFVDGVQEKSGTITNLAEVVLPHSGLSGTPFNWLGRSCYPTDSYLKKTLIYGFSLYRQPMTSDNLISFLKVPTVISDLNNAYAQDSDYREPLFNAEVSALDLGDLTAVTADIPLRTQGNLDATISISWKSSSTDVVSNSGTVIRPDAYDANVILTATLTQGIQIATKSFTAHVLHKPGTEYTYDLMVHYNFNNSENDSLVTDLSEKHYKGIAKQGAKIITLGTTVPVKVLCLGDSLKDKGYFDLGSKMGSVIYHLNNYTMGAYFRIDTTYNQLTNSGNFLWNFSNSNDTEANPIGYLICMLGAQRQTISATNYKNNSEREVSLGLPASKGGWHHFAYTQQDSIGTIYIDGFPEKTDSTMKLTPMIALAKAGSIGTPHNWLGHSCFLTDSYLRQTLISDFRLYNRALTSDEISTSIINVSGTIPTLNVAYNETPYYDHQTSLKSVFESPYKVISTVGRIQIIGLNGNEKVSLFDIMGRQLRFSTPKNISAKAGIYIVKINNYASKVVVR